MGELSESILGLSVLILSGIIVVLLIQRLLGAKGSEDWLQFLLDESWRPKPRFLTRLFFLVTFSLSLAMIHELESRGIVTPLSYGDELTDWKHAQFWLAILEPAIIYTLFYLSMGVLLRCLDIADVLDPLKSIFSADWKLRPLFWLHLILIFVTTYIGVALINISFKL